MTAPTPPLPTFTTGQVPTASDLNGFSAQLANLYDFTTGGFLTDRPMVSVGISRENREIPTNTDQRLLWDYKEIDTDHMWSGVFPETVIFNTPGLYRVGVHVALQPGTATNATPVVAVRMSLGLVYDAAPDIATDSIAAGFGAWHDPVGGAAACSVTVSIPDSNGEAAAVRAWLTHTAGVTLAMDPAFGGCRLWAVWLGPLP